VSDVSYVIEIASQVSGVSATSAELDTLAGKLSGNGAKAAMFDDALAQLSGEMKSAKAAVSAANTELSEGQAHYAALEQAAVNAAKSVERMEVSTKQAQAGMAAAQAKLDDAIASGKGEAAIERLTKGVGKAAANLRRAGKAAQGLDAARAASKSANAAVSEYAVTLDQVSARARDAVAAQDALGDKLRNVAKIQKRVNDNVGDAATNLATFRGALGDIGGPLADFGERLLFPAQAFVDLSEKFGRGTAVAMVAGFGLARVATVAAKAVLVLTAALAAAVTAAVSFALYVSNAARSLALTRKAAEVLTPALRGLPWREVTSATGVAESRLRDVAKALLAAKVSAAELLAALRAAAIAESALGQGGADQFIADMIASKKSVSDFAAETQSKLGGIVARQMLSLEAQGARFKMHTGDMFSFDIDPALEGLRKLVALFDKNSASGRALKAAVKGVLDPIIANAKTAALVVEAFALGFLIAATKIYIEVKPAIDRIGELLGIDASDWSLADVLDVAADAGKKVAGVFAAVGVVLIVAGAAIGVVVGAAIWLSAEVVAAGAAVAVAFAKIGIAVLGALGGAVDSMLDFVGDFTGIGADLIGGLIAGIFGAKGALVAAVSSVVGGAVNVAESVLGVNSKSKVFASIGGYTGEGFVAGIEGQQDAAHGAIKKLTDPGVAAAESTSNITTSNSATSNSTTNSPTTIVIEHVEFPGGGAEAVGAFRDWIEGLALQGAT